MQFEKLDREGIGTSSMSRQPMYKHLDTETGKRTAIRRLLLKPELQDSFSQSAGLPSSNSAQEEDYGVPCMTIREVSLLKVMNHKNVARLVHVEPDNEDRFLRLYLEYAGEDMTTFLKKNPKRASDPKVIKDLLKQLLDGVNHYHSAKAAHGNLRAHNVLIELDTRSDRSEEEVQCNLLITNLQLVTDASAYRAPELLLGSKKLTPAADMFSVGCIFYEMLMKKSLFDADDKLDIIFRLMGTPNEDNWPGVTQLYGEKLSKYRKYSTMDLSEVVSDLESAGVDLLSKLLCLDPSKRVTAADALKHGYFANVNPKQPPETTTAATASSSASTSASVNP
ncbi:Serine/threonine protein kinase [Trema orientale]|uniref:cyclin-dependent kinase n=1 Tax=Trema orientale TaxID=63057 RepID=A0A2P5BZB8_TREOI|nr:Serine/threonine protein kinase [Trema orientale]